MELNQRLASLRRGVHRPQDLLTAATARGLRQPRLAGRGRLAAGAPADFLTVAFDGPRLAGADRGDPLGAVLFAAAAADVRDVVVGGEHVVRDGAHQRVDVAAELERSIIGAVEQRSDERQPSSTPSAGCSPTTRTSAAARPESSAERGW